MSLPIELTQEAADDIDHLWKADQRLFTRILNKIESLQENPKAGKPLVGNHKGEFALRVGNYRIVYLLTPKALVVLTVKHRKHVY